MLVATALKKQPPSGEMLTTFVANAGAVNEPLAKDLDGAWYDVQGELGAAWCGVGELGAAWCDAGELGAAWCDVDVMGAASSDVEGDLGTACCDVDGQLLCPKLGEAELVRPKQGEASDGRLFDGDDMACVDGVDRALLPDVLLSAEDGANSCSSKTSLFGGQIPQEANPFTAFDMVAAFKYASLKRQLT